jgi:hypothetical protein
MQHYCKTIGALAAASALVAGIATAEVEYEISTGYSNEYLWRGISVGQDLVEAGLDVSTEYNGIDLGAGLWYGSFDSALGIPEFDVDQHQLYAEASKDLGFATGTVGYLYNYYENIIQNTGTQEVYFGLSRDLGFAQAALTYYWDIEDDVTGFGAPDLDGYAALALTRGFELSQCLNLNTGVTYGYLVEQGQSAHLTAKVALDYAFRENATISPFVAYSTDLNGDNDTLYGAGGFDARNYVVGGAMLNVRF